MQVPGPPGDANTGPRDRIQLTWGLFQRLWNVILPAAADDFLGVAALASGLK